MRDGGCEDGVRRAAAWCGAWWTGGGRKDGVRCSAARRMKSKCTALAGRFLGCWVDLVFFRVASSHGHSPAPGTQAVYTGLVVLHVEGLPGHKPWISKWHLILLMLQQRGILSHGVARPN